MKLVRQTGFPIERFRKRLEDADLTNEESKTQLIKDLHQQWMEKIELRRAQIEAGTIAPKKKKPASKIVHDPMWAEAKRICRLNAEDIRKAKELGISPRSLIKNVPSPSQKWKAPVKVWINELYEKRFAERDRSLKKSSSIESDIPKIAEANLIDTSDVDWVPSDEDLSFDPTSWGDGVEENAW